MIGLRCKHPLFGFIFFLLVVFLNFAQVTNLVASNSGTNNKQGNKHKKTTISADQLISDSNAGTAVFVGHVTLTQGKATIKANKVTIYYHRGKNQSDKQVKSFDAIEKIRAEGQVDIRFDDLVAKTSRAVYTKKNQVIVLSGPGSLIKKGDHHVSGLEIIVYIDEKSIRVSGNGDYRVEAVFSQEKIN